MREFVLGLILALLVLCAVNVLVRVVGTEPKATTEDYNKGYEAGARFVVKCYVSSNVFLGPLVVSNSMTISNCLFLNYYQWSAIGVDHVPTNADVHINVKSITVDAMRGIIE